MATPPPSHPVDPQQVPPHAEPVEPIVSVAPEKKGGKGKQVLRVLALIVLLVVVKVGFSTFLSDEPVHAKSGDCVQVTGSDTDPKVSTKDCTDKDANYKVVKVVDDTFDVEACAGTGDAALAQQLNSDKFVLCMESLVK